MVFLLQKIQNVMPKPQKNNLILKVNSHEKRIIKIEAKQKKDSNEIKAIKNLLEGNIIVNSLKKIWKDWRVLILGFWAVYGISYGLLWKDNFKYEVAYEAVKIIEQKHGINFIKK